MVQHKATSYTLDGPLDEDSTYEGTMDASDGASDGESDDSHI